MLSSIARDDAGSVAAPGCLCLAGPTASGKSAAALAIAEALEPTVPVEIVSVDSALVYRGMDIGTAKPNARERAQVPHHLIDLIEPTQAYSAARFVADASRAIAEITGRGHVPLLVGGTMLYFKALAVGLDSMPEADTDVRAELDARAAARGWPALHAELAAIDPLTALRLAPNDAQRIQRALEVHRVSGQTMSSLQRRSAHVPAAPSASGADSPFPMSASYSSSPSPPPPLSMISLEPSDRAWLHERIALRFADMLAAGLLDEVRHLRARGDLRPDLPSMRCVGYRQAWQALEANDLSKLPDTAIAATRQLAKRQLTWLRSMPWRRTVACDAPDALPRVVDLAVKWAAARRW